MEQKSYSKEENQKIIKKSLIGTGAIGAAATAWAGNTEEAEAIAIADVETAMTAVITAADGAADAALPIGAALVGMSVIGMIIRRFIMS